MVTLVIELNQEQGKGRESQVQPPYEVWERFFGVSRRATRLPTFRLLASTAHALPEQRKVVRHHHNLTLEVSGARCQRPAILVMKPDGVNAFRYHVSLKRDKDFARLDWLLREYGAVGNGNRRWVILSGE